MLPHDLVLSPGFFDNMGKSVYRAEYSVLSQRRIVAFVLDTFKKSQCYCLGTKDVIQLRIGDIRGWKKQRISNSPNTSQI